MGRVGKGMHMFDEQQSRTENESMMVRHGEPARSSCRSGYPLVLSKNNEVLTICSMHGGRRYRRQLMDMGLRPGMRIKVMRAGGGGPVLLQVGETRLGIGRSMAEKIEVVPAG